jgi:chromatin segregation and condensation protein Rec8/ScpA/Scc1 (kleisin family)
MGKMFEGVKNVAEKIKQGAKEMRKKFSEKFENAKKELADKIMGAKSPEDMIALGKKLQEQGETLKAEEAGVKQEELSEDQGEAIEMNTAFDKDKAHGEALEMNAEFKKDKDHEEALGINKEIDEAKAAEAKAQEQAKFAEEVRLSAEADKAAAAKILKKLQGGDEETIPAEKTETVVTEEVAPAEKGSGIDAVEINNRIVNLPEHKQQAAIDSLAQNEIQAIAKDIAKSKDAEGMISFLRNFKNKTEIIMQPEITNKLKEFLSAGSVHVYNIDRILDLPSANEIFSDQEVQKGVQNSVRAFLASQNGREWPNILDVVNRVVNGSKIDNQGLRTIAEGIKHDNKDMFNSFVQHFSTKRIYPEVAN